MKEIKLRSMKYPGFVIQVDDEDFEDLTSFRIYISGTKDDILIPTLMLDHKSISVGRYLLRDTIGDGRISYIDGNNKNNQRYNIKIIPKKIIDIEEKVKVKTIQKRLPEHLRDVRVDRIMEKLKKNLKLTPAQYFGQIKIYCQTVLEIKHIEINTISLFSYWFQITKEKNEYYIGMNDALPTSELLFYSNHLQTYSWSICNIYLNVEPCYYEEYNEIGNSVKFIDEKNYKKSIDIIE